MAEPLPPIVTGPGADPAQDLRALFDEGLAELRRLSRVNWTDHNTHDPGITMLEMACYALTDLAYRHGLPFEDLIASETDNAARSAAQFHAPAQVLPNRALTDADRRRQLIDLPGVKNAWLEIVDDELLYADLRRRELRRTPPAHPAFAPVRLGGLIRVKVEFMDSVSTAAERAAVLRQVGDALEATRNLAEDFVELRAVRAQYFALCAEVDLDADADVVEVAAQLLMTVTEVLAPPVPNHDLDTLLARGLSLPEILDGPPLRHGFIDEADLQRSALPAEIRLSDLIGAAMDVAGVRSLREVLLNPIERTDEDDETAADADPGAVVGEAVPVANPWRVPVRAGRLPRLSLAQGRLVFSKRGLPVMGFNLAQMPPAVTTRLAELREAARLRVETPHRTDVSPPAPGRARALADWTSFQLDFPAVYGIGSQGLGERADEARRAQALQLQGWLLFFDQLMADQLALLAQAKHRLSVAPDDLTAVATRFSAAGDDRHALACQVVDSIRAAAPLYPDSVTPRQLVDAIETNADATRRQQRLLDHLLARVGEDFADYSGAMASAFGTHSDRLIGDKARFLADVARLSQDRAGAFIQHDAPDGVWNSANVSGLEQRVARLLGIQDFTRRNLGLVSYDTYNEIDQVPDSIDEYRFRVRHAVTNGILLSSSTRYPTPEAARAEMILAIERGQLPEGYQRAVASDGRHYFNVIDAEGAVLARRIQYFDDPAVMDAAISELISYLNEHYSGEGLYLVEHILLRPRALTDPLMPICTDPACGGTDIDPYSHRVHLLLPAYAGRFQDFGFRQFVEATIRREMPAHLMPTVCWLGSEDMARFEGAWRAWLEVHAGVTRTGRADKLRELIAALVSVKSVYPTRALFDCTGDDTRPPFLLGKTSIGRGPTG